MGTKSIREYVLLLEAANSHFWYWCRFLEFSGGSKIKTEEKNPRKQQIFGTIRPLALITWIHQDPGNLRACGLCTLWKLKSLHVYISYFTFTELIKQIYLVIFIQFFQMNTRGSRGVKNMHLCIVMYYINIDCMRG